MENKDMTGVLFPVENKQSDKHPNLTGNVLIKGEKYYISAWTNTAKSGKKYISLKINEDQKKQANTPTENDDIPF
tara:strand:+ start:619 stop:843 length:225 start_codon:yes stop_codon:yes gene_type:complete